MEPHPKKPPIVFNVVSVRRLLRLFVHNPAVENADVLLYFDSVASALESLLAQVLHDLGQYKVALSIKVSMTREDPVSGVVKHETFYFRSATRPLLAEYVIPQMIQSMFDTIHAKVSVIVHVRSFIRV